MNNVKEIRNIFIDKLQKKDFVNGTIEILNANFVADEGIIFGTLNKKYAENEHNWYLSQDLNLKSFNGIVPKIWENICDKNKNVNSNYGYLVFSDENFNQYKAVIDELKNNIFSRRAIIIYTRPKIHKDAIKNGMNDFICTNTVQYLYRNNCLNAIVNMRSNDAIYGYKYDFLWQKYVLNRICEDLRIDSGIIYWNVGSFHIYEKHYYLIK